MQRHWYIFVLNKKGEVKVKVTFVQALRFCTGRTAHRGSRGIALLFYDQRHCDTFRNLDIWLAVHHSITSLLLPTWYTNFSFIHTNYIKLNSSTCFERSPLIIKWPSCATAKAGLSGCTRRSLAESDDTRGCICTICVVDLLMMSGLRSEHVEEFNLM